MEGYCYLNGRILPLMDAHVSVLDRGFVLGDGIYEVVPVYAGAPFRAQQHFRRLQRSLAAVRIPLPFDEAGFLRILNDLVHNAGQPPAPRELFYLQITRGVAPRVHAMPPGLTPTVFAMLQPLSVGPSAQDLVEGASCVSAEEFRWRLGQIKSTSLLGSVMARQISQDAGAAETILHRDGWLTEGSASNVWVVKAGQVFGVPRDSGVLEGIRYELLEELCAQESLELIYRPIAWAEVLEADELLLSSASKEILAVTQLDGRAVGSGQPGPVWHRLYAAYQNALPR